MAKIYVASSWRNRRQPEVVSLLRAHGHEVYDFRNPEPGDHGFHWSEIDDGWQSWEPRQFKSALMHAVARRGFNSDMRALAQCDVCVLVLPCGRSAHLEAGWACGSGKALIIYMPKDAREEPELMYSMGLLCLGADEMVDALRKF